MSNSRLNYSHFLPTEIEHLNKLEASIAQYSIDSKLIELIKLRVSQINGCSFCVSYHTQCLRRDGETNERIDMIPVWQEAPCFTPQEKSALRWAEAVTRLSSQADICDTLYAETLGAYGEEGLSQLTLAVAMINVWNRLAVPFQADHAHVAELLKTTH